MRFALRVDDTSCDAPGLRSPDVIFTLHLRVTGAGARCHREKEMHAIVLLEDGVFV